MTEQNHARIGAVFSGIEEALAEIEANLAEVVAFPKDHPMFRDDDLGYFIRGGERGRARATAQVRRTISYLRSAEPKVLEHKHLVAAVSTILWDLRLTFGPPSLTASLGWFESDKQADAAGELAGLAEVAEKVTSVAYLWLSYSVETDAPDVGALVGGKTHYETFQQFMSGYLTDMTSQ